MVKTLIMKGKSTSGIKIESLVRDVSHFSNIEMNLFGVTADASKFEVSCNISIFNDESSYDYQICLLDVNPNTLSHSKINDIFDNANVYSESNISQGVVTNKEFKFSNNIDDLHAIDMNSLYSAIKPTGEYYVSLRTIYNNNYLSNTQRTYIDDLSAPIISDTIIITKNLFTINLQCNIADNAGITNWYVGAFTSNVSVTYSDNDIIDYIILNNKYAGNSDELTYNLNVDVECAYDYSTNKLYSLQDNTTYYIYILVIDSSDNKTVSPIHELSTPISHPKWTPLHPHIETQIQYNNGNDIVGFGSEFINQNSNVDDAFYVWHIFDRTYTYDEAIVYNVQDQNRHIGWLSGLKAGSITEKEPTNFVYVDLQSSKTISGLKIYNYGFIGNSGSTANFEESRTESVQVYLGDSITGLQATSNLIASGSNYVYNEDWLMNATQLKTGRYIMINIENSGSQSEGVGIHEVEIFGY